MDMIYTNLETPTETLVVDDDDDDSLESMSLKLAETRPRDILPPYLLIIWVRCGPGVLEISAARDIYATKLISQRLNNNSKRTSSNNIKRDSSNRCDLSCANIKLFIRRVMIFVGDRGHRFVLK